MNKVCIFMIFLFISLSYSNFLNKKTTLVNTKDELYKSISELEPGEEIILANGVWKNVEILFEGKGTKDKPIILRAENPGKVFIEGKSYIKLAGEFLIIDGLYFRNGFTPVNSVIEFKINNRKIANNSTVKNCVINEYVQLNRYDSDHWIEFWGRNNTLDRCFLSGKFNQGPTIRINLNGNEHIRNYHQITNNYFGPRPRKGGPKAETIQIGDSKTSMAPSHVNISNNLFERCNGEVEVISSKTNFNEFKNNIFYKCEGSLVFRHGNYCLADGNIFIGDKNSSFNGGIRVINTGHWITNNYFYMIKGDEFRSPLAIMNGIPKSPLNRYNQVTDVVVAYNSWIDCISPWQISVGANMDKRDVLPEREIRSARPLRTILANNIIYNNQPDEVPIKTYDKVDGITFKNNIIDNQNANFTIYHGVEAYSLKMNKINDWLYIPAETNDRIDSTYTAFGFEDIQKDLFNNARKEKNNIGSTIKGGSQNFEIDKSKYGPHWYSNDKTETMSQIITVSADKNLSEKIKQANNGDIIELDSGTYKVSESLVIDKKITIRPKDKNKKAVVVFYGTVDQPLFEMNPKGNLFLENVFLQGNDDQFAFAPLKNNMSFGFNLFVDGTKMNGFKNIVKAYKGSFADTISFSNSSFSECQNGIELAAETDDKGDYNAEFLFINNCQFNDIQKNVINFYRGGYDESTIGGNLVLENSTFKNCGQQEQSKILLKTRGIINVDISNNTFENNPVKLIALLWGEKNNYQADNIIKNSGNFKTEKYLKQKLVY